MSTVFSGLCFAAGFILSAATMNIVGSVLFLVLLVWLILGVFEQAEYEHRWHEEFDPIIARTLSVS